MKPHTSMRRQIVLVLAASLALGSLAAAGCSRRSTQGSTSRDSASMGSDTAASHGSGTAAETEASAAGDERAALEKTDPTGIYGAGIHLETATNLDALLENPQEYEGRIVQVGGTVGEVCQKRGCWFDLAGAAAGSLRVKVPDGEIVIPRSAKGRNAVVEGIVERIELTEEQHRAWKAHEAEETGRGFDPGTVSGPLTLWRIQGFGVRIDG